MIEVNHTTLTYRSGKGVFDLDFKINTGTVMGYLGPNGSGKTTTIRLLTGFMKPDQGSCTINGLDCFKKAPLINRTMGYIPGEIAFIEGLTGDEFLRYIAGVRGLTDNHRQLQLIDRFEFSPKGSIRKFSKGMKQKLGIVAAFMHDPEILILDEPTSGLDPLMQSRFVDLIQAEKKRGKTILMSSHLFDEVERTCDEVIIIKDGRIVDQSDIHTLKSSQHKSYRIQTDHPHQASAMLKARGFDAIANDHGLTVTITGEQTDTFIKALSVITVRELDVKTQTLEDRFMHYYKKEESADESFIV